MMQVIARRIGSRPARSGPNPMLISPQRRPASLTADRTRKRSVPAGSRSAKEGADWRRETASFGPFELTISERLLRRNGVPIMLGGRALDLLVALLERPGEVLTKRYLLDKVWPDLVVEEVNLRVHMAALRRALGDAKADARYISTVAGRGYCFVASVSWSNPDGSDLGGLEKPTSLPLKLVPMFEFEQAVRAVAGPLATSRFVTIVGPGGMGESTVAVALGHACLECSKDAVAFVDLGAVSHPLSVPGAPASKLGLPLRLADAVASLVAHLRDKWMLVILDPANGEPANGQSERNGTAV